MVEQIISGKVERTRPRSKVPVVEGDTWVSLGCTEPGETKFEMITANHVSEVNDLDRNDGDGAARAGGAVHDAPKNRFRCGSCPCVRTLDSDISMDSSRK